MVANSDASANTDSLGTQAPSAVIIAEGDVIAELEELEATHTLCVICSGPLQNRKAFCTLSSNSSYVLIKYISPCFQFF